MEFFTRLFKPAPRDDALLNMLRDNAAHMAIDNTVQSLPSEASTRYESALTASATHIKFIDSCSAHIDTILVDGQPLLYDTDNNTNAHIADVVQKWKPQNFRRIDLDRELLRAKENPQGQYWIDSLHPDPSRFRIAIKTDNDLFSPTSFCALDLDSAMRREKKRSFLLSGFFDGICILAGAKGALRKGYNVIIDPAECYDSISFTGSSYESAVRTYPRSVVVTEPGQVAHVLGLGPR